MSQYNPRVALRAMQMITKHGPLSAAGIADRAGRGLTSSGVSGTLIHMHALGLVTRERREHGACSVLVYALTRAGRAASRGQAGQVAA